MNSSTRILKVFLLKFCVNKIQEYALNLKNIFKKYIWRISIQVNLKRGVYNKKSTYRKYKRFFKTMKMSSKYNKDSSFWMNEEEWTTSNASSVLHILEIIIVNMYKILKAL